MFTVRRSRTTFVAIAALFAIALVAPAAAQVDDQPLAAAPTGPSWDETSGYGTVEVSRATIGHDGLASGEASGTTGREASAAIGYSWDETSGYGSVEASRATVPEAAIGASWDESSGYASVEASRATIAPGTSDRGSLQEDHVTAAPVSPSWDETSGYGAVEENRAVTPMHGPR